MADHPILFSAPMMRALLEGRKTQTRRLLAPSRAVFGSGPGWQHVDFAKAFVDGHPGSGQYLHVPCHIGDEDEAAPAACPSCWDLGWEGTQHRLYPHWQVGDRLWVKETFATTGAGEPVGYRATSAADGWEVAGDAKWQPSIHMPRWASRLTLTLTAIRIQRLQEISAEDSLAEGVLRVDPTADDEAWNRQFAEDQGIDPEPMSPIWLAPGTRQGFGPRWNDPQSGPTPEFAYRLIWEAINGKDSWAANPWVLAFSFDVAQQNIGRKAA